jgi:hypothetical protein
MVRHSDVMGFFSQITTVAICNIALLYAMVKSYFSIELPYHHSEKGRDTQHPRNF